MKLKLITQSRYLPFRIQQGDSSPVIEGTYRPLSRAEIVAFDHQMRDKKPEERGKAWDELIAKCVLSWDVEDDNGIAPITVETVSQIPQYYWKRLEDHIMGYAFSQEAADDAKKS